MIFHPPPKFWWGASFQKLKSVYALRYARIFLNLNSFRPLHSVAVKIERNRGLKNYLWSPLQRAEQ
ncbi:MAG: hypothetical protein CO141_00325 [Candidatus Moranbacteria bacterium CG_4_9_14_3_um_filter_42_9]|nr:MAG: hypothetical protein CO141_00325 [Candidatus Moranbacteria bacterium CG_4_9_14_3_um_filter_42_9]